MKQIITLIVFMVFSSVSNVVLSNDIVNSEYIKRAVRNNIIFVMKSEELNTSDFLKMIRNGHEEAYEKYQGMASMDGHVCVINPKDKVKPITHCFPYKDVADEIMLYLLKTNGEGEDYSELYYYGLIKIVYSKSYNYYKKEKDPKVAKDCSKSPNVLCYSLATMFGE